MAGRRTRDTSPGTERPPLIDRDPDAATRRLQNRIKELEELEVSAAQHDDVRFESAERNIVSDLREIFGVGAVEFTAHQYYQLWKGPQLLGMSERAILEARRGGVSQAKQLIAGLMRRVEERRAEQSPQQPAATSAMPTPAPQGGAMPDSRDVFVVHGRDQQRVAFFFDLLRRMGLHPMEFDEAIARTGSGSPYIGDVVKTALEQAMAVVVLFTGDDLAHLRHDLAGPDEDAERTARPQPRPNVILEAGMALAMDRNRTVIVEVPPLRGISDLHGVHVVRFSSGDATERNKLAARLRTAGCNVRTTGADWLTLEFPQ